ncbi:calcium-dependent secretion activator 1-like, partial [Thalassophryne amazonica]|uniref:calcium-dependent secretion activator 1-like n=1 Tax=Thalassophryne amazonica TaxID=390379 RepID=UPI001470C5F6
VCVCVCVCVQQWYTSTMNLLGTWLTDRMDLQLHVYQLKILIRIVKKKYRDFRLQAVLDSTLNSKMYETVKNRLTLEEATASVRDGGMQGVSMTDSEAGGRWELEEELCIGRSTNPLARCLLSSILHFLVSHFCHDLENVKSFWNQMFVLVDA